ncbi:TniB family NTP-binding protein, partial [Brevundimonas vancanneytii]|uniref:TniB family NTP-binding protein n=1 Tax=Brevundimonas vancanneytii TaxID=1325724 RepID=UPI0034D60EA1
MTPAERRLDAGVKVGLADDILVPNRRQQEAHEAFDYLRARASQRSEGGVKGVLLVAPSQSGKSKILNAYRRRHNTEEAREKGKLPILMVTLKANQTTKGLAQNILVRLEEELGIATLWQRGNENHLLQRVQTYISAYGIELLILDEFQHLVHSERKEVAVSVAETVKGFMNDGLVPVVMSGIEEAWRPIRANRQLQLRCIPPLVLDPIDAESPEEWELFGDFLVGFQAEVERLRLIDDAVSVLGDSTVADNLHTACGGVIGEVCSLLKDALYLALCQGDDTIT